MLSSSIPSKMKGLKMTRRFTVIWAYLLGIGSSCRNSF